MELEPEPEPELFKIENRNRNQNFFNSRNRNHNFSKVGTGTVKNSYGSTTLLVMANKWEMALFRPIAFCNPCSDTEVNVTAKQGVTGDQPHIKDLTFLPVLWEEVTEEVASGHQNPLVKSVIRGDGESQE